MDQIDTSASADARARELATLIATLNRFLLRFGALDVFQDAKIGSTEWSALSMIAGRPGTNNRQLANQLGVSPQRVNQITDSLKLSGLITISTSTEDARVRAISLTADGIARLKELNTSLEPKIAVALEKRPALLARVNKLAQTKLMSIVAPPKAERIRTRRNKRERAGA